MRRSYSCNPWIILGSAVLPLLAAACGGSAAVGSGGGGGEASSNTGGGHASTKCGSEGNPCDAGTTPIIGITVPEAGPPVCGDQICNGTENCESCPEDCKTCQKCDYAPTCTGAVAIPTAPTAEAGFSFDNATSPYSCGMAGQDWQQTNCLGPRLRMRISKINVAKRGVDLGGVFSDLYMFCSVDADDGSSSEVAVTPLTKYTSDNVQTVFTPTQGVFWGQKELKKSVNNLTVTFTCFESTGQQAYQSVLGSIQTGAAAVGAVGGAYGWAFDLGSVAAGVLNSAVSSNSGNTARLNVQQTIDAKAMLDLTNGRTWTIHQSGQADCFLGFCADFDWTLEVEAWGCAAAGLNVK